MLSAPRPQLKFRGSADTPRMRIRYIVCTLALSMSAGCGLLGQKDSPTAPSGPPSSGTAIVYSVVGASDVVGYGSSKACLPFEDCDGNGYAWVAARQLRSQGFTVTVGQLGIPGAVISRTFQDLALQYGRTAVPLNLIESEMPFVRKDATVVTVFTGGNDVNVITSALGKGAGGSNPNAFIDERVAGFAADYAALVAGIRGRAPRARIIALNLPNLAALPYLASATLAQKQAAQRAAVRMTTTGINTIPDVSVIDLMCDARFYQGSTYSADGFHPSDGGYAIMAGAIVMAINAGASSPPKASCPQMTLY